MPAMWKPGGDKPRAAGDKPKQQPRRRDDGEGAKIAGSALPPRESAAPRPKATLSQKTLAMKVTMAHWLWISCYIGRS